MQIAKQNTTKKLGFFSILLMAAFFLFAGCSDDGVGDAIEDAGDEVEDAADEIEDTIDDATDGK